MCLIIISELFEGLLRYTMLLSLVHLSLEKTMHMNIQANGFVLTAALKASTEKHLLSGDGDPR